MPLTEPLSTADSTATEAATAAAAAAAAGSSISEAQDTPQAEATAAVADVCASRAGAEFMVNNKLTELMTALLHQSSRTGDGEHEI